MEKKQKCKKNLYYPYYSNCSQSQLVRITGSRLYFLNQYIITFETWHCLESSAPLLCEIDIYAPIKFFVTNLMLNNFYLKHFLIQAVFFAVFSPKVNLLSSFGKVKYCAALACCAVPLTTLKNSHVNLPPGAPVYFDEERA